MWLSHSMTFPVHGLLAQLCQLGCEPLADKWKNNIIGFPQSFPMVNCVRVCERMCACLQGNPKPPKELLFVTFLLVFSGDLFVPEMTLM